MVLISTSENVYTGHKKVHELYNIYLSFILSLYFIICDADEAIMFVCLFYAYIEITNITNVLKIQILQKENYTIFLDHIVCFWLRA